MMEERLLKYHWKKVSIANNSADDVWIKDKYAIVHGYYATTLYLEELVDGKFLDVHDPNRNVIKYNLSDLNELIHYVEFSIRKRITDIRINKLQEIGI